MSGWLQRDWCSSFILALAHFLWQGTLVAILLATGLRAVKSVSIRYWLAVFALLIMTACPLVTFCWMIRPEYLAMPFETVASIQPAAVRPSQDQTGMAGTETISNRAADESLPAIHPLPTELGTGLQRAASRDMLNPGVNTKQPRWWQTFAPQLTSLYLVGVSLMLLRLIVGLWGGRRLQRRAVPVTDAALVAALQRQASALGLKLLPLLAYCEQVTVPTVVGVFKPMILLPLTIASGLSVEQIESVLAHELAHLRRCDHLVNLCQRIIESFLFVHPAVWWVSRRIRDEREHCCDDLVVASGALPLDYVHSLLRVAELGRQAELLRGANRRQSFAVTSLLATGDRPSTLRQRVARLLGYQSELNVRAVHSWLLGGVTVASLGIAWTLTVMTWLAHAENDLSPSEAGANPSASHVVKIPGGLEVEFVGITKNEASSQAGWRPDGMKMGDVGDWPKGVALFGGNMSGTRTPTDKPIDSNAYDLLMEFRGLRRQPSFSLELPGDGAAYVHAPVTEIYRMRISTRLRDQTQFPSDNVRIGLTDEPWGKWLQISAKGEILNPPGDDDLYRSSYSQIELQRVESSQDDPQRTVLVLRQPQRSDRLHAFELRAVDTDGEERRDFSSQIRNVDGLELDESEWEIGPFSEGKQLARFEYRVRPYRHWVTFADVSLQPGTKTEVKATVESVADPNGVVRPVEKQDNERQKNAKEMDRAAVEQSDALWHAHIAGRLPDWMKPHYNKGLLASLDDGNDVVSITTNGIVTDEMLAQFKTLGKLRQLDIELTNGVTPAGLAYFAELRSLDKLALSNQYGNSKVQGNDVLQSLVGLSTLRELSIRGCGITDAGAKLLEKLPQLTALTIQQEGRLSDEALKSIGTLKKLRSLDLSSYVATEQLGRMQISGDGIRHLSGLDELESLQLVGHDVPADVLRFPKLTSLGLGNLNVDDAVADRVSTLGLLSELNLTYCGITDAGLKNIATLPGLKRLDISSSVITDAGIQSFAGHQQLEHLSLRAANLTDESLGHLAKIKTLTRVDLYGSGVPGPAKAQRFSIAGLQRLKELPKLETLWLTNFDLVGGGYVELKDLKHLRTLTFMMCNINDVELDLLETALPETDISSATGGGGRVPKRFRQHQNLEVPISAITIEGNTTIPNSEIAKHLKIRPGQPVTQQQIKDDVDALIRTRWFASVEPVVRQLDGGNTLVFRLLERPIVRRVEYRGNKKIKQKVFDRMTHLVPGQPYDPSVNRECARRIQEFYKEKGFPFATVELERGHDDRDPDCAVIFDINEGPKVKVTKVTFDGNKVFSDQLLQTQTLTNTRILNYFSGKYDPTTIGDDLKAIRDYYHSLGYFDVKITPKQQFADDKATVEIHYDIDEGVRYKIRNVSFACNSVLTDEDIRKMIQVKDGDDYNKRHVLKDHEALMAKYAELGRPFASVRPVARRSKKIGVLDIVYKIYEDDVYNIPNLKVDESSPH